MKMQPNSNKNTTIVLLRVISMVLIILCHIIPYYSFIPGSSSLGGIFNVGIFVFLIISGFLYGKKQIGDFKNYIIKRWQKVCLPACVTVFLFGIAMLVLREKINLITFIFYLLNLSGLNFIIGPLVSIIGEIGPLSHLWFIAVIMICYLCIPLFEIIRNSKLNKRAYFAIILVSTIINFAFSCFFDITFIYIITFYIGYTLGAIRFSEDTLKLSNYTAATIFMIIMQVLRIVFNFIPIFAEFYGPFADISHTVLGLWIFMSIFMVKQVAPYLVDALSNNIVISWFDKNSFYIYVVHHIFTASSSIVCIFTIFDNIWIASLAFIMVTLIATIILDLIMKELNKKLVI